MNQEFFCCLKLPFLFFTVSVGCRNDFLGTGITFWLVLEGAFLSSGDDSIVSLAVVLEHDLGRDSTFLVRQK